MSVDAAECPEIQKIRAEVPEFESTFQEVLQDEEGDLGVFQAMSTFATWVRSRLDEASTAPEIQRSFAAIEHLLTARYYQLADALVTEFIEVVFDHPKALEHMGPATLKRLRR